MGVVTERPQHPQYAIEASRNSTFHNWPQTVGQPPERLAKAGFFYTGTGCIKTEGAVLWDAKVGFNAYFLILKNIFYY